MTFCNRLATLARLPLGLLDGFPLRPLLGFLALALIAFLLAGFARLRNRLALGGPRQDGGVIRRRSRPELLEDILFCFGSPLEPLKTFLILVFSHCSPSISPSFSTPFI